MDVAITHPAHRKEGLYPNLTAFADREVFVIQMAAPVGKRKVEKQIPSANVRHNNHIEEAIVQLRIGRKK